ncbi:MAG: hypothetical protein R3E75_08255 [Steroidobacteraceae bacterium]
MAHANNDQGARVTYDEIAAEAEKLSYRDKFRLAQLLIQLARKEEEENHPERRAAAAAGKQPDAELVEYVASRLLKLKPGKKEGVFNSIGAMFQFQGGVSDADKEKLFAELVRTRRITVDAAGRVSYPS